RGGRRPGGRGRGFGSRRGGRRRLRPGRGGRWTPPRNGGDCLTVGTTGLFAGVLGADLDELAAAEAGEAEHPRSSRGRRGGRGRRLRRGRGGDRQDRLAAGTLDRLAGKLVGHAQRLAAAAVEGQGHGNVSRAVARKE